MPTLLFPGRYKNTKPAFGARINLGHTLAHGLIGAYLFNEQGGPTVFNSEGILGDATMVGLTPADVWKSIGEDLTMVQTAATGYLTIGRIPTASILTSATPYTVIIKIIPNATDNVAMFSFNNSASSNNQDDISILTGGAFAVESRNPNFQIAQSTTVAVAGLPVTIAGVFNGVSARHVYVNGVLEGSNADTVPAITYDTMEFGRLGDNSPSREFSGDYIYGYIYDHALTAAEIKELSDGPYQIIQPIQPIRRYWQVSAGGRTMGSLAGYGGLAGPGGIAGPRGGIAG